MDEAKSLTGRDTAAQVEKFLRDIRRRNRLILSIIFLPILGLLAADAC